MRAHVWSFPADRDDLLEVIDRVTRSIPLGTVAVATARRTAPCTSATLATTRCRAAELSPRRTIVVVRSATAVYNCLKLTGSWATMRKSSLSRRQESRPDADGPTESVAAVPILALKDLTRAVQRATGFPELVAALRNGRSATIDGAWGSAAALTCAALGLHAPTTLIILMAHVGDVDDFRDDVATFAGIAPRSFPPGRSFRATERRG